MSIPQAYITDVQGLCCLLRIRGDYANELLEILEIIDTAYKQDIDVKQFSICYFGDCSKLFRYLYAIYADAVAMDLIRAGGAAAVAKWQSQNGHAHGRSAKKPTPPAANANANGEEVGGENSNNRLHKHANYFTILSFVLFLNSLKKAEYMPFLLWFCIKQHEDKVMDKIELANLLDKFASLIGALEDKKTQLRLAKAIFTFKKYLDDNESTEELKMEEINSMELRSGQPFTSILLQLVNVFRDFTLGANRWNEIAIETQSAMKNLKSHYEVLERSSQYQPNFEKEIFNTRKMARRRLRVFIRFLQKFKGELAMTEINVIEDDSWYVSIMKTLGFAVNTNEEEDDEDFKSNAAKKKGPSWSLEGSQYIEEAKVRTNEEVVAIAHHVCDKVVDILELCRDALHANVGNNLKSVSYTG